MAATTKEITIETWDENHPRWLELQAVVEGEGQSSWLAFTADFHQISHVLVATAGRTIVGFLRFVIQAIGSDDDLPALQLNGRTLLEAKVIAFAVLPAWQRQGIGRALQQALLQQARQLGCYQVRSYSGDDHPANHRLKLALGFAAHPVHRHDGSTGVYFVMPLRPTS